MIKKKSNTPSFGRSEQDNEELSNLSEHSNENLENEPIIRGKIVNQT